MSLTDPCAIISELMEHFQTDYEVGITTCLAQLKSNPKRCKELIKEASSLDLLVQLIRCQNHAIVNLSLSILADACCTNDARKKVKNSKIGFYALLLIRDLKLDSRLHCRACRLIGNLAECSWQAEELCNNGAVEALKAIIISKTNMQTYCTAIRAMRNIWLYHKHIRKTILETEVVKPIAQLFVMAVEKSNVKTRYTELMDACLKAMWAFLVTLDPRCGMQMQVDKDKQGYKYILRCCSIGDEDTQVVAGSCIYRLCQIPECRLDLGISGMVEQLIALINSVDENSMDKRVHGDILLSLCMLCREAVNRDRIKKGAGLQLMTTLLNKPEHKSQHPYLLQALSLFMYDEIALDILAKHGILEILVAKLMDVVSTMTNTTTNGEKNNMSRKRPNDYPFEDQTTPLKYKRTCTRFSMDFYHNDWSPKSAASASSSPPSTPPLPPYSDSNTETDDMDNIYSPICSDTECNNDEEEEAAEEEAASLNSCKSLITSGCSSLRALRAFQGLVNSEQPRERTSCETYSLDLLYRFSLFLKPIDGLADSMIIKSLMTYIKSTKKEKMIESSDDALKILMKIVGNVAYFMPLLKQGLVFEVQTLPEPEAERCARHLRAVAETGGAIGYLSFILLRGEEEHKLLTAVSIPLLIETRYNLKCLLDKYGGLQLIFRLLAESSHKLHERAIWSICQLAKTLQIDAVDQSTGATVMNFDQLYDYSGQLLDETKSVEVERTNDKKSMVAFELDDGSIVKASRRILCRCSDVFSTMLEGNFSESGKKRVRLRSTSRGGLKTLILAASGEAFQHRSIESLLDAVLLADRYLVSENLLDALTESSIAKVNRGNFYRAWRWARSYFCHELRSYCVKSFLTTKMSWNETIRTFRDFYGTEAFDEFLREIKDIIMVVLCQC